FCIDARSRTIWRSRVRVLLTLARQELVANRQSFLSVFPRLISRQCQRRFGRRWLYRHRHFRQARTVVRGKHLADRRASVEAIFFRPGRQSAVLRWRTDTDSDFATALGISR